MGLFIESSKFQKLRLGRAHTVHYSEQASVQLRYLPQATPRRRHGDAIVTEHMHVYSSYAYIRIVCMYIHICIYIYIYTYIYTCICTRAAEYNDTALTNKMYRRTSSEKRPRTRSCHEWESLILASFRSTVHFGKSFSKFPTEFAQQAFKRQHVDGWVLCRV